MSILRKTGILEASQFARLVGSPTDVVERQNRTEGLHDRLGCEVSTDHFEGDIATEVALGWAPRCVEGGGVRECVLLL